MSLYIRKKDRIPDYDVARERLAHANAIIEAIGSHGRRFFNRDGRHGKFEIDVQRSCLVFVDAYRDGRSDVIEDRSWPNFSNGGTLKALVVRLGEYIKGGPPLNRAWIGTERGDGSNIWGYRREDILALHAQLTGMPGMTRIEDDPIPTYQDTREINTEDSEAPGM